MTKVQEDIIEKPVRKGRTDLNLFEPSNFLLLTV